jgi:hypothetical protein
MTTTFFQEALKAAKQAPRTYFAPIIGTFKGIREELKRLDRQSHGG